MSTRLLMLALTLLACGTDKSDSRPDDDGDGEDDGGDENNDGAGARCDDSQDCEGALVCDREISICVECRTNGDCDDGSLCRNHVCEEGDTCRDDTDCSGPLPACGDNGVCVECATAGDCTNQACVEGTCRDADACTDDVDCAADGLVCAEAEGEAWPEGVDGYACQECGASEDCPAREACDGGLCYDVCDDAGRVCGEVDGVSCGECADGATCAESGLMCYTNLGNVNNVSTEMGVTDSTVYVRTNDDGDLGVVGLDIGTGESNDVRGFTDDVQAITADRDQAYLATRDGGLFTIADGRTSASDLGTVEDQCDALAVDDDYLYCALADNSGGSGVYRMEKDGSRMEDMMTDHSVECLYLDGDELYYGSYLNSRTGRISTDDGFDGERISRDMSPISIVAGGGLVFTVEAYDGGLYACDPEDCEPELLDEQGAKALIWFQEKLWYNADDETRTYDPATGEIQTVLSSSEGSPFAAAVGPDDLLYITMNGGPDHVIRVEP